MSDELTEFLDLDVSAIHLVGRPASGFPTLLAKAALDTLAEVRSESRSQPTKKGSRKMKKKQLRAALEKAQREGPTGTQGAPMSASQAITLMKQAADQADRQGDTVRADGIRRDLAVFKFQIAERRRQERGSYSRMGPASAELFSRTGRLGPDSALGGV